MKGNKFRKKFLTVILIFNVFFIGILYISSYRTTKKIKMLREKLRAHKNLSDSQSLLPVLKREEENVILFWTKYHDADPLLETEIKAEAQKHPECFKNCRFTNDRRLLGVSEAVIFHSRDMRRSDLPPVHMSDQVWIYMQRESPSYTKRDLTEYANIFNWTMTYRRDSDVYYPYGRIVKRSTTLANNWTTHIELKERKKLVLWIVSHCDTTGKREVIADRLQQLIHVDIYGTCGDYPCTRDLPDGCFPVVAPQYKFYLAFENSLCSDYITEKFYKALTYNLVPIVYGGVDYASFAPPNSFIDASNFESPKALAEYLIDLSNNDEKYLEYFEWKQKYKVQDSDAWCKLCEKVKQQKRDPKRKIYGNLWKWWHYTEDNRIVKVTSSFNETNDHYSNSPSKDYTINEDNFFIFPEAKYAPACQDEPLASRFDTFDTDALVIKFNKIKRWLRNTLVA